MLFRAMMGYDGHRPPAARGKANALRTPALYPNQNRPRDASLAASRFHYWGRRLALVIVRQIDYVSTKSNRFPRRRCLAIKPGPPEGSIVQTIITPAALREGDVHAVINERVLRYTKLRRVLSRSAGLRLRDRSPARSVYRLLCRCVSVPGNHRCTKGQAGNYQLPHVRILLCWAPPARRVVLCRRQAPPGEDVGFFDLLCQFNRS